MIPATGKKITAKAAVAPAVKVQKSYEPIPADGVYVVKKNDSFSKIASRFGLRASDIAEYNNLPLTKVIQPGQKLRLPPRRAKAGKPAAKPAAKPAVKPAAKPAEKPAAKPAEAAPAANADESIEDLQAPSVDNIQVPSASISKPAQDATVAEIVTEDTTVAKLAVEYARTEMDIRKLNPHLAADGNVKRGTRIVL
jgi:LysM repeat protein